jgi:hypothetical protein
MKMMKALMLAMAMFPCIATHAVEASESIQVDPNARAAAIVAGIQRWMDNVVPELAKFEAVKGNITIPEIATFNNAINRMLTPISTLQNIQETLPHMVNNDEKLATAVHGYTTFYTYILPELNNIGDIKLEHYSCPDKLSDTGKWPDEVSEMWKLISLRDRLVQFIIPGVWENLPQEVKDVLLPLQVEASTAGQQLQEAARIAAQQH